MQRKRNKCFLDSLIVSISRARHWKNWQRRKTRNKSLLSRWKEIATWWRTYLFVLYGSQGVYILLEPISCLSCNVNLHTIHRLSLNLTPGVTSINVCPCLHTVHRAKFRSHLAKTRQPFDCFEHRIFNVPRVSGSVRNFLKCFTTSWLRAVPPFSNKYLRISTRDSSLGVAILSLLDSAAAPPFPLFRRTVDKNDLCVGTRNEFRTV